jgi:hypothetical protein
MSLPSCREFAFGVCLICLFCAPVQQAKAQRAQAESPLSLEGAIDAFASVTSQLPQCAPDLPSYTVGRCSGNSAATCHRVEVVMEAHCTGAPPDCHQEDNSLLWTIDECRWVELFPTIPLLHKWQCTGVSRWLGGSDIICL